MVCVVHCLCYWRFDALHRVISHRRDRSPESRILRNPGLASDGGQSLPRTNGSGRWTVPGRTPCPLDAHMCVPSTPSARAGAASWDFQTWVAACEQQPGTQAGRNVQPLLDRAEVRRRLTFYSQGAKSKPSAQGAQKRFPDWTRWTSNRSRRLVTGSPPFRTCCLLNSYRTSCSVYWPTYPYIRLRYTGPRLI